MASPNIGVIQLCVCEPDTRSQLEEEELLVPPIRSCQDWYLLIGGLQNESRNTRPTLQVVIVGQNSLPARPSDSSLLFIRACMLA